MSFEIYKEEFAKSIGLTPKLHLLTSGYKNTEGPVYLARANSEEGYFFYTDKFNDRICCIKWYGLSPYNGLTTLCYGPVVTFYFRSPEHHPLELIYFPDDKGSERWHERDVLFLGIDHTAIAVSDTDRSLKFYQKTLGVEVVGESLNYGETQEKLTAIPNARVKITGLRDVAGEGIGLEFLQYIQEKKGREAKHVVHDLSATKLVVACHNLDEILICVLVNAIMGRSLNSAMVSNPDNHYILLQEK